MVLQRAPQRALLYGATAPGATVTTRFNGTVLTTVADVNGTWRQRLPPVAASKRPYTLEFQGEQVNETASMMDVLFGDVYLCSGQVRAAAACLLLACCCRFCCNLALCLGCCRCC